MRYTLLDIDLFAIQPYIRMYGCMANKSMSNKSVCYRLEPCTQLPSDCTLHGAACSNVNEVWLGCYTSRYVMKFELTNIYFVWELNLIHFCWT